MAFDPPFAMDGTTHDAELFRRAVGSLIAPAGGVVAAGDLAVTQQSTPAMSVQVGTGQVWVPGTSTPAQGPYYSRNGSPVSVTISAPDPTLPRVDVIIVQVEDVAYAGALKQITAAVVPGTPTSGASLSNRVGLGSVPASSLVLAYVLVAPGASSILNGNISNVAPSCTSAFTPSVGAWTPTWVPLLAGAGVSVNVTGSYPAAASLDSSGSVVRLKGAIQNTSGSAITSGVTLATVAAALRPSSAVTLDAFGTAPGGGFGSSLMFGLMVSLGGLVSVPSISIPAGATVFLDGLTYTLS